SMLDNMNAEKYVVQDMKEPVIEKSALKPDEKKDIENVVNAEPFQIGMQSMKSENSNDLDIMLINPDKDFKPALSEGHYPKADNEVVINKKLTADGVKKGDTVTFKNGDKDY